MDARPIGVFDSGLGGLTTVKKLAELLPEEDIVYLGDTGRTPYGSRSRDTIIKYARQDANFLVDRNIKAMVIACNTVCSVAYTMLEGIFSIKVYEVISAPAKEAAAYTKNGRVGVIGTAATIRSGAYEAALKRIASELLVISLPCPLFVPLVENGRIDAGDTAALAIAEDYLKELKEFGADTLILGCTHYPLIKDVISKVIGGGVELIDSGAETAKLVARDIQARGMAVPGGSKGVIRYFVTDSVDAFSGFASRFLGSDVGGMVEQVQLD
ncbi:MAG: glutamate racemase [Oscillospiraceae bacterium]|nr:glutamate racemase [Oscillospiraceae bacterium]